MDALEWLYPVTVLLLGYLVLGITGFGSALVVVPLLAWKWPLPEVVVFAILLDVPASILHGGLNVRQVRWRAMVSMLPGIAVGSLIGLWLMGQLDRRWPLFILGVYIAGVGFHVLRHGVQSQKPVSQLSLQLGSGIVGVIQVMFATAGPVVLALLQRSLHNIAEVRATVPVVMVIAGSIAIAVLMSAGQIDGSHSFQRWLVAMPIAATGVILGNRVAKCIPAKIMKKVIAGLLLVSGLSLTGHLWM
jgi:uncharacterized membrane protein YfcA